MRSAWHDAHLLPPSAAPHSEQNFPDATAPQEGQTAEDAGGGGVEVIHGKLVGRSSPGVDGTPAARNTGVSAHLITIDLDGLPPVRETDRLLGVLLDTLARAGRQATFFVPKSRTASRQFLLRVVSGGHEVALLTTSTTSTPYGPDFQAELRTVKAALEGATGHRVEGHRHVQGLRDEADWVYDVLLSEGFQYDSSWLPTRTATQSSSPQARSIHAERRWGGTLLEVPTTTSDLAPLPILFGSARSIRRVPLPVLRHAVKAREQTGSPLMMHLRESELRQLTKGNALPGSSAELKAMARLSAVLGWAPFTTVSAAVSDLLRSAPILER